MTLLTPHTSFAADRVLDLLGGLDDRLDTAALCTELGLHRERLNDAAAARLPAEQVVELLRRAAEMCGDPLLGLHLAEAVRPRSVLSYATCTQRTLADAFRLFCRYQHLTLPGPSFVIVERGTLWRLIALPGAPRAASRHLTEFLFARIALEGRRNVDPPMHVAGVDFRHPAVAAVGEYERVLGQPVRFGQPADALEIPLHLMAGHMMGWNPVVAEAAMAPARAQVEIVGDFAFRERVELALRSLLLAAEPGTQASTADSLGLSAERLQRGLWAEGTSFAAVKSRVQCDLAAELIAVPTLSRAEAAARAGFAGPDELDAALCRDPPR